MQNVKKRLERLESAISSVAAFKITLKDGKQVTGDFDTAFSYAVAYPSTAVRIEETTGCTGCGRLPALLNALLDVNEVIENA